MGDVSNIQMHDMFAIVQQLQQENANLRNAMEQLQVAQAPIHVPAPAANPVPQTPKEPRVSLPEKFDGDRTKLRDFVNQIRLVFRLQPQRYATEETRVGLIGTLLSGTALSWFSSLLEKNSPLLADLDQFLEEFSRTFGERDRALVATTKLRTLQQRSRPASAYVAEFQQLACDLDWNDAALITMFRWGLRDDIKTLLLNLPKPTTLSEAITQTIDCDNRLFEQRQERRLLFGSYRADYATPTCLSSSNTSTSEPMQIDTSKVKKLSEEEKERRRKEHLCLYCGGKDHMLKNCPLKPQGPKLHKFRSASESRHEEIGSENDNGQPH
jgi:hypothetical protein